MSEVTRILSQVGKGDTNAAEELLQLVYEELRKLAAVKLAQEKSGQTLQPTALVHEAYIRLVDEQVDQHWDSRGHFFAAAAEAMRRILVEKARRKRRMKMGGDWQRVQIAEWELADEQTEDLALAIDDSLEMLAEQNTEAAELVKLRFFGGLTLPQAANAIGVSSRTADRLWAYAKAWLHDRLEN